MTKKLIPILVLGLLYIAYSFIYVAPQAEKIKSGNIDYPVKYDKEHPKFFSAQQAFEEAIQGSRTANLQSLNDLTNLPNECLWCEDFFQQINQYILNPELDDDSKLYLARILSNSGKIEALKIILNNLQDSKSNSSEYAFYDSLLRQFRTNYTTEVFLVENLKKDSNISKASLLIALANSGSEFAFKEFFNVLEQSKFDETTLNQIREFVSMQAPQIEAFTMLSKAVLAGGPLASTAAKVLLNSADRGLPRVLEILESHNSELTASILDSVTGSIVRNDMNKTALVECAEKSKNKSLVAFCKIELGRF